MKYFILLCAGLVLCMTSLSCKKITNFLDKPPGVDVTEDTIFSTRVQAETIMATLYHQGMHSMLALNNADQGSRYFQNSGACDEGMYEATWADQTSWNTASLRPDNVNYSDTRYYVRWPAIRTANIILERADGITDADAGYKAQIKGEAKFIRALNYFEMFKRYGGMPIVDKRLNVTDVLNAPITRSSVEETVNFIIKDCDDAAAALPNAYPSNLRGRATKGAALFLKAKTLLWAASPLFNTATPYMDLGSNNKLICYGNFDATRWQKAADAAKAVIDWAPSGNIKLITDKGVTKNYKYAWEVPDNEEIILENKLLGIRTRSQYPWPGIFPTTIYAGYGGPSITLNFVKFYEKKDGTPQTWDDAGGDNLNQKYAELDPRFAQTILYNGAYLNADYPSIQTYTGGAQATNCLGGAWQRKSVPDALSNSAGAVPNNYIFRFAEAYLIYAEALNEAQGPVAEAYNAVNIIRNRSGMPNLPAGLSKEGFRARVRNERAIELAFEDNRLFDILRWMIAENEGGDGRENVWHQDHQNSIKYGVSLCSLCISNPYFFTENVPAPLYNGRDHQRVPGTKSRMVMDLLTNKVFH